MAGCCWACWVSIVKGQPPSRLSASQMCQMTKWADLLLPSPMSRGPLCGQDHGRKEPKRSIAFRRMGICIWKSLSIVLSSSGSLDLLRTSLRRRTSNDRNAVTVLRCLSACASDACGAPARSAVTRRACGVRLGRTGPGRASLVGLWSCTWGGSILPVSSCCRPYFLWSPSRSTSDPSGVLEKRFCLLKPRSQERSCHVDCGRGVFDHLLRRS